MNKILVPIDFSAPSIEALKMAISIASKNNGEITLLHVINFPPLPSPYFSGAIAFSYDPSMMKKAEEQIRKGFEKVLSEQPPHQIKIHFKIIHGDVFEGIEQVVKNNQITLVIMGTSGTTGMEEIFIGSNAEKVIRNSPVPVLALRKASDIKSIKKILLPSDLSLNHADFIDKIKELQDFFDAHLDILLINTPYDFKGDKEAQEALNTFVAHYNLKNYTLHFKNYHNKEYGIIAFAKQEGVGLVAMATNARKGLAHLFLGSIAENVVNHIHYPFWSYPIKK